MFAANIHIFKAGVPLFSPNAVYASLEQGSQLRLQMLFRGRHICSKVFQNKYRRRRDCTLENRPSFVLVSTPDPTGLEYFV